MKLILTILLLLCMGGSVYAQDDKPFQFTEKPEYGYEKSVQDGIEIRSEFAWGDKLHDWNKSESKSHVESRKTFER